MTEQTDEWVCCFDPRGKCHWRELWKQTQTMHDSFYICICYRLLVVEEEIKNQGDRIVKLLGGETQFYS